MPLNCSEVAEVGFLRRVESINGCRMRMAAGLKETKLQSESDSCP
uniref:Uncharacterized protein n=1 Tax=Anguilla anguilla TaxID=7936 RepID=A0A0E9W5Z8_ANGAN